MKSPKLTVLHQSAMFLLTSLVLFVQGNFPSYICASWLSLPCIGGDRGLTSTDIIMTYECLGVEVGSPITITKNFTVNSTYALENKPNEECDVVEYLFEQLEHGGGNCNCLNIYFDIDCDSTSKISLCGGSASIPRRKLVEWNDTFNIIGETSPNINEKISPFQLMCDSIPYILDFSELFIPYLNFSNISFLLIFNDDVDCNTINEFNEGVEFSVRLSSRPNDWIPISFRYFIDDRNTTQILIGDINNFTLRGYVVNDIDSDTPFNEVELQICDFNKEDAIQFRWQQTSQFTDENSVSEDVWILNDVVITLVTEDDEIYLINETFTETELNSDIWPEEHARNAEVGQYCSLTGMVFGLQNESGLIVVSRALVTKLFDISVYLLITSTSSTYEEINRVKKNLTSTTATTTLNNEPMNVLNKNLSDREYILAVENYVITTIMQNEDLQKLLADKNHLTAFLSLNNLTETKPMYSLELVYIYSTFIRSLNNSTFNEDFLEIIINTGYELLKSQSLEDSRQQLIVGTTVLFSLDILMLTYFPPSFSYIIISTSSSNPQSYAFTTKTVHLTGLSDLESITVIDTDGLFGLGKPQLSLSLPVNLLRKCTTKKGETVKITANVYRNISYFFTSALPDENSTLGPDIVASSIQFGLKSCPTSNYSLKTTNVTITFGHSSMIKEALTSDANLQVVCVFLEPVNNISSLLNIGRWSTRGCTKNTSLSSTTKTVCECNHLTHFAILLSPRPPPFRKSTVLNLSTISYVGVTISVVAMVLTIIIFIILSTTLNDRPLLTIRNYIHINLCISLAIAQITFVAGIDKTGPLNNDVSIHCSIIAVLLQYFFLVSFMWMLMEGVVLYLALVKLFVTQKYRYIVAFTLMSYGIPLLYMGVITIPLGFSLSGGHYYGYNRACFLNPETYFIWAFIAPVIFIFLANIGFFVMATTISWKQHMKRVNHNKALKFINWFKSTIPLMIVMGLNWIIGLLVVEVKQLAPLAYISTIMSAFQGAFIFVSLVVLSEAVRNEFKKWWTSQFSHKKSVKAEVLNKSLKVKSLTESNFTKQNKKVDVKVTKSKLDNSMEKSMTIANEKALQTNFSYPQDHPAFDDDCFEYYLENQINAVVTTTALQIGNN